MPKRGLIKSGPFNFAIDKPGGVAYNKTNITRINQ